jgi:hypothetical protein
MMWFLLKSRGWGENEQNSDGGQYNTSSITFRNIGGQQTAHLGLRRLKYNMFSCYVLIITVSSSSANTTQGTKSLWITETCLHVVCVTVIWLWPNLEQETYFSRTTTNKVYENLSSESHILPSRYKDRCYDTTVILLNCFANAPKNSSPCIMELMKILHTILTPILYTQKQIFLKMIHLD